MTLEQSIRVRGLFAGYKSHLAHIKEMVVVNLSSFGDEDYILAQICHKTRHNSIFELRRQPPDLNKYERA